MCVCVCLEGCGVNGHDFSNGAVIPTGDRCQECICVVCYISFHFIFVCFWNHFILSLIIYIYLF